MSKNKGVKKTLAVFMAALMVLSCWVFTPIATEVAAAEGEPGSYYYRIDIDCTDEGEGNNWQEWAWRLFGKYDYGTGAENAQQDSPVADDKPFYKEQKLDGVKLYSGLFEGYGEPGWFPNRIHVNLNSGPVLGATRKFIFTVKLYVGSCKEDAKLIYEADSGSNNKFDRDFDFTQKPETYSIPAAKEVKFSSADAVTKTIPADENSTETIDCSAAVYDQYGVQLTNCTPTYYVTSEKPTSYPTSSGSEFTNTNGIYLDGSALKVTSDARMGNNGQNERTVYVSAVYPNASTTNFVSKQITLKDPTYTYTFDTNGGNIVGNSTVTKSYGDEIGNLPSASREGYTFKGWYTSKLADSEDTPKYNENNKLKESQQVTYNAAYYAAWQKNKYTAKFVYYIADGTLKTEEVTEYYGKTLIAPNAIDVDTTDVKHEFIGWNSSVPSTMPAKNITYTAQYNTTNKYADITALKAAVSAAEAKEAEDIYKEGAYTDASVATFEEAYKNAKNYLNNKTNPPASAQSNIDTLTNALTSAQSHLEKKMFVVLFIDEDDNILKDGYYYVEYGENIYDQIPTTPEKEYNAQYHYEFAGWVGGDESAKVSAADLNDCKYVTKDMVFVAKFTAINHDFVQTDTPSSCTTDGVITKTCDCGYSYSEVSTTDVAHHDFETKTIVEATCANPGYKASVCKNCGAIEEGSIIEIPATAHEFDKTTSTVYTPATCTGEGVSYYTCTKCGEKDYFKTDATAHKDATTKVENPTCTSKGYTVTTCPDCGLTFIRNETAIKGHKTTTTTVAPTCTSYGYTLTTCKDCDYTKIEIGNTLAEHKYDVKTTVDATCISYGYKESECSVCHGTKLEIIEKTDHSYSDEYTVDVQATCISAGKKSKHCTTDGCSATTDEVEIAKLGHSLVAGDSTDATCTTSGVSTENCSRCDYTETTVTPAKGHTYAETKYNATCTSSAYTHYECSCGAEYDEITGGALGHNFEITTSKVGATQLKITASCKNCNYKTEYTETVAAGHNYNNVNVVSYPTCKEDGKVEISCSETHDGVACTSKVTATIPADNAAHKNITTVIERATCEKAGKAVTTCTDCGAGIATETIPATGHSFSEKVGETTGDCQNGATVTLKCANCTETATYTIATNPDAHKYTLNKSVSATCTTPAYDEYVCSVCGKASYKDFDGEALGHTWGEPAVNQVDTVLTITRTCTKDNCGAKDEQKVTVFAGHTYARFENVEDATCTETGLMKVYCTDEGCNAYIEVTVPINSAAHKLKTEYVAAKCEKDGYVKTYCENCTHIEANTAITALGHDYFGGEETEIKAATCIEAGLKSVKCKRCDSTTEVGIPKTGHSYEKVSGGKTPTCTEYGWDVYKCTNGNCPATYNALVNELGHTFDETKTVVTAPTCTEKGSTTKYCVNCKTTIVVEETAANGHFYDYEGGVTVTAPTCKTQGYTTHNCQNCDYSYTDNYTPIADHTYTSTVTAPTCTEKGYTTHKCACGYSYIDSYVDAIGHDFNNEGTVVEKDGKNVIEHICNNGCGEKQYEKIDGECSHIKVFVETVKPTCTTKGYDVYKCSTCETEFKENYTAKLGHKWDYWTITKYPGVDSNGNAYNGSQERVCKRCGIKETEEIIEGKFYLVTFYNYDGTRLIRPAYYSYGKAAMMPDFTPTKPADNAYTYTFKGYSFSEAEINCVTKRMAVMAEYEAHERTYDVTYRNENGDVLQIVTGVKYTQINKAYTGATPTKASDNYYTYTFNSWSINCDAETGTATATATYAQKLTDSNNKPDSDKPGIFTKFIAWLKAFIKKLFGIA